MKNKRKRSDEQLVIDRLRKKWMSDKQKFKAAQKQAVRLTLPDGREKTLLRCECCSYLFYREETEVNHKQAVGPLVSVDPLHIEAYKQRLFVKSHQLELLCKSCHRVKTKEQRTKRGA